MNIAAIILAAGYSNRLGRPKQSVVLAGETLLQRAVRTADEAGLSPIIVVIRDAFAYTNPKMPSGTEFVINREAEEGIASSIRRGIDAAAHAEVAGAVIMACDQPAVNAAHLRSLIADKNRMTGSRYTHTIGVPAYFPRDLFVQLEELRGDSGARKLLQGAYSISAQNLELDIDTQQDLDLARALFDSEPHAVN